MVFKVSVDPIVSAFRPRDFLLLELGTDEAALSLPYQDDA